MKKSALSLSGCINSLSPNRLFWSAAALHVFFWTLIPTLISANAPLDVIEGFVWGREWLIGTHKHPPMQAWWLEIIGALTGNQPFAPFLASSLAVAVAFWAVLQTGKRLTDDTTALLGVLLLEGIVYYNFTTPEFNPNVLQLPFWALTCWSFHRAIKENKWFDWALLGAWAAGGMYVKYSTAILLVALTAFMFLNKHARRRLGSYGPYLTVAVGMVLLGPHLKWLIDNDFLPFDYADGRAEQAEHFYQHLTFPIDFFLAQLLSMSAMLVLFIWSMYGRVLFKSRVALDFDRVFLNVIALGPVALVVMLSFVTGSRPRDMWGACLWNFSGLWLASHAAKPHAAVLKRFAPAWLAVFVFGWMALIGSNWLYPYIMDKDFRVHFPGKLLAERITDKWQERFNRPLAFKQIPLTYVIGDTWPAGNVAYYAPDVKERPHVVIDGNFAISPWAAPESVWEKGGVLVWCYNRCSEPSASTYMPVNLLERFPGAELQYPILVPYHTKAPLRPVALGWAILPPASLWPKEEERFYCRNNICPARWFGPKKGKPAWVRYYLI